MTQRYSTHLQIELAEVFALNRRSMQQWALALLNPRVMLGNVALRLMRDMLGVRSTFHILKTVKFPMRFKILTMRTVKSFRCVRMRAYEPFFTKRTLIFPMRTLILPMRSPVAFA